MHDASDDDTAPLVSIRGLRKQLGGTLALADVDLDIREGSVLALLGHNGAGKSTLIKILAGVHRADEGRITVAGHPLGSEASAAEMSFIHQDLGLVEWMTVAENIALGTGYPRRAGLVSWRQVRERCTEALGIIAGHLDPDATVADLTRAERSLVAIARALSTGARLIVLDEPTASLPAADCARLFDVLHTLRDGGHGIVYVSHRLDEVYRVADRFAVLRDGRLISRGRLADHGPDRMVHDIVGHEAESHRPQSAVRSGSAPVLRLTGASTEGAGTVDLELRAGEILGMVGLTGAGHLDLGRALAGAQALTGGEVLLGGEPYRPTSPAAAFDAGLGFVTSNRQEEGCALELTVRENFLANPRADHHSPWHWISPRRERAQAASLVERFDVRPADSEAPISTLSGGNQQKVMIGRWLRLSRRVVILEEPTAGVDVGAKAEIYRLLDGALAEGLAVLLVSTDFEEVAHVCDRALVFVQGAVAAELSGAALTVTELTHAASAMPAPTGTADT
ncbi:sugar ABC transporter ATP-binding protein [Streptomyces sporangiiformans]|uniref:sugar ABC transporter ATP-binding protein n=1 Tax=Streptomyces sporangiiformans TaxID=2315329 RepID=UPI001F09A5E4|nr:sugar ABC transporter ATP-binding protein [Streptomyces sporangiiformans]